MSSIVVPDHLGPRNTKRANDFCTMAEALNMARSTVIEIIGPMAKLLTEACDRIKVLEDAAGIVAPEVSENTPSATASISTSGDIE